MAFLVFDKSVSKQRITLNEHQIYTGSELREKAEEHLTQFFGAGATNFYLLHNGKLVGDDQNIQGDVQVIPRLLGGKGGFGSMLRAIGAQIEKTTNREACRDLSGRRLRDINEEKRLKKWIAEQAEREQEALKRKRKKLEKLNEIVKHEFKDEDYTKARLEMPEKINEAVEQGLKAGIEESTSTSNSASGSQEPKEAKSCAQPKKKIKGGLWVDDLELLEDSESNSEEDESPKKKIKLS